MAWGTGKETQDPERAWEQREVLRSLQKEHAELKALLKSVHDECVELREHSGQLEKVVKRLRNDRDHLRSLLRQATTVMLQSPQNTPQKEPPFAKSLTSTTDRGELKEKFRAKEVDLKKQIQELQHEVARVELQVEEQRVATAAVDEAWTTRLEARLEEERGRWEAKERAFHAAR